MYITYTGIPAPPRLTPPGKRREASGSVARKKSAADGRGDDRLRLFLDGGEVVRAAEGFRVELVHVLGAGRAGGEPSRLGDHLEAANRRSVAGGRGQRRDDLLARELGGRYLFGGQPGQRGLLRPGGGGVNAGVGGCSVPFGEAAVQLRRRLPGDRRDLRGEQREDDAVLVGRPYRPVVLQERRPGALLAAKGHGAVEQPGHEPLEPDRHLKQRTIQAGRHPVDHRRADQRLADGGPGSPAFTVPVQVVDGDREVVVGVEQPRVGRDDTVPVRVGVVPCRDRELVLPADQAGHRERGGAVHPDLAVPVQGHEPERRVRLRVDDGQVEAIALADLAPVRDARPAQRVGTDAYPGAGDRGQADHTLQRRHVVVEEIELPRIVCCDRPGVRYPAHRLQVAAEQVVCPVLYRCCDAGVGRAAVWRVVLEAAVRR